MPPIVVSLPPIASSPATNDTSSSSSLSSNPNCHGFFYGALLIVPSVVFVGFLAYHARKNLKKLYHGRSHVMISYYAIVWIVSLLNLAWCLLQGWQCSPGKETAWNFLSLFTTTGLLCLEISLVVFLLQGHYINCLEALSRTFLVTGGIVGVDLLLKAVYVFGFGVPLFVDVGVTSQVKWTLWSIHTMALLGVYGFILFVRFSKWREELPPRPSFYRYIIVMFVCTSVELVSCLFAGFGAGLGIWLYNILVLCYHSLYLPFLYVTFLADFFKEEDFLLDNAYYSEMKDAGFFDADWD
ncbi:hypothetical protein MLD38_012506 [Melastoma candidum]|uniref:Uncharacterized protein n=1 Tax=Melastoma candidum TaxID=119954 RepID=A0ACB9R7U9_9MYRT|nr:hypothetical protein MLD38_012506 [Melastoma candidum]